MTGIIFPLVGGFVSARDGAVDRRAFAGDSLRQALVQFTGRRIKAFAARALVTALVQLSSATTVMVMGFVSAGLLTFPRAVGVVLRSELKARKNATNVGAGEQSEDLQR